MKTTFQKLITCSGYIACVFVFFSCQKNLTQFQTKDSATKRSDVLADTLQQVTTKFEGQRVIIDTVKSSIHHGISLLSIKDSYYDQKVKQKTTNFYTTNSLKTKWLCENAPNQLYYALLDQLKNASHYGLISDDYDVSLIEEQVSSIYKNQQASSTAIAGLDIHITEMFFLFSTHLTEGKIKNVGYGNNIWLRQPKVINNEDEKLLAELNTPEQLISSIIQLQPHVEQYAKLQKALEYYRALEQTTSMSAAPIASAKEKIRPQESHTIIPWVRTKLSQTDSKLYAPATMDTVTCLVDSSNYDNDLATAVKLFQTKHGLDADGILGEKTLKFLNQSFKEKADLIALNMERIKWLPENYGDNYILVNVPEFKLRVFENEKQALEMKVITGAPNKPTPIFNDILEHIVFSPTWTVPQSIIKEEIIPRLKKDPAYYAQKNYAFFKNETAIDPVNETWGEESINPYQYRVVQQPGRDNSLGLVKFLLKNSMSVYLHDTPNHRLFSKSYRALSHGCVRLDEPARFAEYLLRDQKGWGMDRVEKSMDGSNTATIQLKKRYPVYIEYHTVWVDDNNEINFREDIYGHDKQQLKQLYPVEKASTLAGL